MQTTWDRVRGWRLHRHLLAGAEDPRVTSATDVVRRVAGLQAQVGSCAREAVAVRGRPAREVDTAVDNRSLVRTWAMRGTLHLLPSDDAASYLALVASARTWEKGTWQREFATASEIAALAEAADRVLDGVLLTREELVAALGPVASADRLTSGWGTLLKPLAWQGVLCNGPPRGARPTFTSPRSWLPGWNGLPGVEAAAARVIPAYLSVHGPASPATFDAWLLRGATPKGQLRRWFADLIDTGVLTVVQVEGEPLHVRAEDVEGLADARPVPGVRLLPGFDPWILGPGTTDTRVVPPEHRALVSRTAGWIAPVVLVDGLVVGTWTAPADGADPEIALFPGRAAPDRVAFAEEVDRWRSRRES